MYGELISLRLHLLYGMVASFSHLDLFDKCHFELLGYYGLFAIIISYFASMCTYFHFFVQQIFCEIDILIEYMNRLH